MEMREHHVPAGFEDLLNDHFSYLGTFFSS